MSKKGPKIGRLIFLLALNAAIGSQAAWSQVIEANDDTGNPSCTLSYNNPSCWDIGVVPNNSATSYAVTIDDGLPIGLLQSATVNTMTIGAGSRLDIGNFRTLTIPGDTGGGDRGLLTLDGTLNLGSTGSNTLLQLLDAYTILTSGSLAPPGSNSITSSTNNGNRIIGAGTAPEALLTNQSIGFTGLIGSFDRLELLNGRVTPNFGTRLEFNGIDSLETSDTTFAADGAGTTLRFSGLSYDGNNTTDVTASNGGTVEVVDVFATALQFKNDFGEIKIRRSSIENSNLIFGGLVVFEGANNRLASSNAIDVDNTDLRLSNGSVTSIEAGADVTLRNGARLVADSTGTNTILNIEGNGGDAVTILKWNPGCRTNPVLSLSDGANNFVRGTGSAPRLNFDSVDIKGAGRLESLDRLGMFGAVFENRAGKTLSLVDVDQVNAEETFFRSLFGGGSISVTRVNLDGNGTSQIEASGGGAFLADNSNLFNISATARQGSTLDFNAATINNSFLGTEGNGQINLRDTELSQVELTGNVQVGGQFRLGTGVVYENLITDPTRATTITAADGVSIDNPIKYELPAGGGLFGRLASESPRACD